MKARIKAINKLGTFYSSYKNVSLNEINQLKNTMAQDGSFKTCLLLEGHYPKEKEYVIIPAELMNETVITIECQGE